MSGSQLLFRTEAREKILRGASTLADAVRITGLRRFDQRHPGRGGGGLRPRLPG